MVHIGSKINIIDNSGAKEGKCVRIFSPYKKNTCGISNTILLTIKKTRKNRQDPEKIKKGKLFRALILRSKICNNFFPNVQLSFNDNCAVLLSEQEKLVGSRIIGLISKYFRYTKYLKILILTTGVRL